MQCKGPCLSQESGFCDVPYQKLAVRATGQSPLASRCARGNKSVGAIPKVRFCDVPYQ